MILEDDSGRIKIAKNEVMDPARFLTGSVIALLGKINTNGVFDTEDFTYATYPEFAASMETDREDGLVAIVSGLEFCNDEEKVST